VIIDTSALLAILLYEEDAAVYAQALVDASSKQISAANFLEAAIIIDSKGDKVASQQLNDFIQQADIHITAVTSEQTAIARQAYIEFGKGRHKARLNSGDCFAYALAKISDAPLLFKGNDFIHTDIRRYLP
jgi:ribonuclease VapC